MRLKNVAVKNFRLLQDVSLVLEGRTTVVVGRNNCGKTSLTEVIRRLLEDCIDPVKSCTGPKLEERT